MPLKESSCVTKQIGKQKQKQASEMEKTKTSLRNVQMLQHITKNAQFQQKKKLLKMQKKLESVTYNQKRSKSLL